MKRWQWVPLVALAGLAAVAVAVLPFRGTGNSVAAGTVGPRLQIDMKPDANSTWCNPVDSTGPTHVFGQPSGAYQVAICATDFTTAIGGFQFELRYNTGLNQCVPQTEGSFLDQNPDANGGALNTTTFNGTLPAPHGLGTGWTCNWQDTAPPTCSDLSAMAFLQCTTVTGALELPFGAGVSEPIAVIDFNVLAGGTDTLQLTTVSVIDEFTDEIIGCTDSDRVHCSDGTDDKQGPQQATSTPTPIPATPTATPAYCGNPRQPTCTPTPRPFTSTPGPSPTPTATAPGEQPPPPPPPPPSGGQAPAVIPPSTGEGSGMPWGLPIAAIIVGLAAASLIGGGICVRFARRR